MDDFQKILEQNLQALTRLVSKGKVRLVFAIAIAEDGPTQVVLVEPEYRESLIIAINEEVSRMLGVPHHIVSTGKLQRFFALHNITSQDLLDFKDSEDATEI